MASQCESSWFETFQVMASFAAILMWSPGKLTPVNVFVAVLALCLHDFKERIFAFGTFWQMTFVTSYLRMTALERVFGCCVVFYGKCRRFKTVHVVARRTFPAIWSPKELPLVRIFVTVHAFGKRHRRFKVPVRVAIAACHRRMLAQ
jgi:hypothetical protein